jgi:hypothetical protein
LISTPVAAAPLATVNFAPATASPVAGLDAIPMPFVWTLAAVSFVVFLIQLWNYFTV